MLGPLGYLCLGEGSNRTLGSPVAHAIVNPGCGADALVAGGPVVEAGVDMETEEQVGGGPDDPGGAHRHRAATQLGLGQGGAARSWTGPRRMCPGVGLKHVGVWPEL